MPLSKHSTLPELKEYVRKHPELNIVLSQKKASLLSELDSKGHIHKGQRTTDHTSTGRKLKSVRKVSSRPKGRNPPTRKKIETVPSNEPIFNIIQMFAQQEMRENARLFMDPRVGRPVAYRGTGTPISFSHLN